jgi:hypothetical protein
LGTILHTNRARRHAEAGCDFANGFLQALTPKERGQDRRRAQSAVVMAALVAAIHVLVAAPSEGVDARDKRGHDESGGRGNAKSGESRSGVKDYVLEVGS